jgi:hypothetical protein
VLHLYALSPLHVGQHIYNMSTFSPTKSELRLVQWKPIQAKCFTWEPETRKGFQADSPTQPSETHS